MRLGSFIVIAILVPVAIFTTINLFNQLGIASQVDQERLAVDILTTTGRNAADVRFISTGISRADGRAYDELATGKDDTALKALDDASLLKIQRRDNLAAIQRNTAYLADPTANELVITLSRAIDTQEMIEEELARAARTATTAEAKRALNTKRKETLDPASDAVHAAATAFIDHLYNTITASRARIVETHRQAIERAYATLAGGIIIAILIFLTFSTLIVRPIQDLSTTVGYILQGQFKVRVRKTHIEELQTVNDAIQRLATTMKLAVLRGKLKPEDLRKGVTKAEAQFAKTLLAKKTKRK